jgi:hypothetical protein
MATVTCPVCLSSKEEAVRVGIVAICGACGSSLVVSPSGTIRRATAADFDHLMPGDRALLVKARSALVRGERSR